MKLGNTVGRLYRWLAWVTLAWGAFAVWRYGWRDLYADQWRLYPRFLVLPFPDNVLFLENGHRPVIPNLLRVAEINWWSGNQLGQWAVGLAFAVLTVMLGWRIAWRDAALDTLRRAAAMLVVALAIFWLANARMLMHPNESVHTYLITLLLMVAAGMGWRAQARAGAGGYGGAWFACAVCGFIATFSFGPGLVMFLAVAMAWTVARAPLRFPAMLVVTMLLTLIVYFALPGGQGVSGVLKLAPAANLRIAAQWLAAPIMYLLLPFFDPNLAAAVPGETLRAVAQWAAARYVSNLGSVWEGVWPQALVGFAGMAMLGVQSVDRWRCRSLTATEFAGLVLGWFGLGVAGVVSLSRLGYFEVYPGQVYASRYLPWPCLFWAGIVLLALGRRRGAAGEAERTAWSHALVGIIGVVATGALVSNPNWMRWARDTQALVRHQATAVLADLYSPTLAQGETVPEELRTGLPAVRDARVAMFGHPAAGRMGTTLGQVPPALFPASSDVTARAYASAGGVPALEFRGPVPRGYPPTAGDYWLVTDERQTVIGYAHYDPLDSNERISGFVRAEVARPVVWAYPWINGKGPGTGVALRIAVR